MHLRTHAKHAAAGRAAHRAHLPTLIELELRIIALYAVAGAVLPTFVVACI